MAQGATIRAEIRDERGKNPARRLRRDGRIPAVIYGGGAATLAISLDSRQIAHTVQADTGRAAVLMLEVAGQDSVRVMLRDWQTDPVGGELLHLDFVRISQNTRVKVKVPVHLTGEPQGVKVQGGIFEFVLREVEVECLPDDIPESITADVTELTIGRNLRVAHLPVKGKVKVLTDPNRVVAHVVALKAEEEKPAAEAVETAPAEPELIRKGKAEEETGAEEAGAESKETK